MKIYLIRYVIKKGGVAREDGIRSVKTYDVHKSEIVTASSGERAREAVRKMGILTHDGKKIVIRGTTVLTDA